MNDRFKFRFWNKSRKVMETFNGFSDAIGNILTNEIKAEPYIIMQCTGLKDKNGTLIYEGDIVKVGNGSVNGSVIETIREVKWVINTWNIPVWVVDKPNFSHYVEVIGNIYENKELLNE